MFGSGVSAQWSPCTLSQPVGILCSTRKRGTTCPINQGPWLHYATFGGHLQQLTGCCWPNTTALTAADMKMHVVSHQTVMRRSRVLRKPSQDACTRKLQVLALVNPRPRLPLMAEQAHTRDRAAALSVLPAVDSLTTPQHDRMHGQRVTEESVATSPHQNAPCS